mmetsp:Transcript_26448/g.83801  ORF Transcript_26448/g.83801 Transcript_26448/m.83801 type:complete len:265 (-) Transcript_26448:1305-2099(-)
MAATPRCRSAPLPRAGLTGGRDRPTGGACVQQRLGDLLHVAALLKGKVYGGHPAELFHLVPVRPSQDANNALEALVPQLHGQVGAPHKELLILEVNVLVDHSDVGGGESRRLQRQFPPSHDDIDETLHFFCRAADGAAAAWVGLHKEAEQHFLCLPQHQRVVDPDAHRTARYRRRGRALRQRGSAPIASGCALHWGGRRRDGSRVGGRRGGADWGGGDGGRGSGDGGWCKCGTGGGGGGGGGGRLVDAGACVVFTAIIWCRLGG